MHKVKREFWKRAKVQVMFISGKKSLPVTVGWRYQRMWILYRRSGGSTDRFHNVVLITRRETDIQEME